MYGRYVPPRIGVHMVHTAHGEGPILILVVGVGSRVEVIAQIVGGKVHIGGKDSPLSENRPLVSEAQHTRIDGSNGSADDCEHG